MTDEFIEQEGHQVQEKVSLIERMWPDDIPDVDVNVEGRPDDGLIGYQLSFVVNGDTYGAELAEDVDDPIELTNFDTIVSSYIDRFRNTYEELKANG